MDTVSVFARASLEVSPTSSEMMMMMTIEKK